MNTRLAIATTEDRKLKSQVFPLIVHVVLIVAIAFFLSRIQFTISNDAQGFGGDSSQSVFYEDVPEDGSIAPLFTEEDAEELTAGIQEMSEILQMNICVLAGYSLMNEVDTKQFCDDTYDNEYGEDTDGVLFYIDLSTGKEQTNDCISTAGKAILPLKNESDWRYVQNAAYRYWPTSEQVRQNGLEPYSEKFKEGVFAMLEAFREKVEDFDYANAGSFYQPRTQRYVYYIDDELYITPSRPQKHRFVLILVLELLALGVSGLMGHSVRSKYKFVTKTEAGVYVVKDATQYTVKTDTFLREHTAKHYRSSSSSSRSGGGGGGGGTHGGGVTHR